MRQVTRKGLITMAAAGGVLALSGGYAHADAGAAGAASSSPGVLSGNSIQVPIDIPVNACGNSVNVGGALNPTAGNDCGNGSSGQATGRHAADSPASDSRAPDSRASDSRESGKNEARHHGEGTGKHRATGASAQGRATGSPGIASGNQVQVPVDIPVNVCGNSLTIGGLLNPVFGNSCSNDSEAAPPPETPVTPDEPAEPPTHVPSAPNAPEAQVLPGEQLAQTGAGGLALLIPAGASVLLAGAGTVLYRRSRSAA